MNDSKHRKRGWSWVREWISVFWLLGERARGGRTVPAIQMSVICLASEGGETMPMTVGDRDSWLSH